MQNNLLLFSYIIYYIRFAIYSYVFLFMFLAGFAIYFGRLKCNIPKRESLNMYLYIYKSLYYAYCRVL